MLGFVMLLMQKLMELVYFLVALVLFLLAMTLMFIAFAAGTVIIIFDEIWTAVRNVWLKVVNRLRR